MRRLKTAMSLLMLAAMLSGVCTASETGYHVLRRIPLGGEGGWDSMAVDPAARRLYIARGTHVTVLDLDTERVAGEIPDTLGAHSIALVPEVNRGYVSNGKSDSVTVFNLQTLETVGQIKTGGRPDAILYDEAVKKLFVFHACSHDAAVLNVPSGEVAARIALDGHPEDAVSDGQGHVFVNLKNRNEVAEIDSRKLAVTRRFSVAPGVKPLSMTLGPGRRLFIGCRNQILAVLDSGSGQLLASLPIGAGVDGSAFDPESGMVFCANGWDGTLTVIREDADGAFRVQDTVATQRGARTVALDPQTRNLYLPTAQLGPIPAEPAPGERKPRPPVIKDTFELLVVGGQ